jgi:hypothetical protein
LGVRTVIVLIVAAAGLVIGGVMLGEYFETPEEASLRQSPEAVPITDSLRREVLERTLTLRGTLAPAERAALRFAPAVHGRIITAVDVEPGVELRSGQVLLEVEGRPVIVLSGEFPPWRDFTSSMQGPDVSQLQSALAELDLYAEGDQVPGTVGHRTLNAVFALYQSMGYEAPPWSVVPHHEFVFLPSDLRVVERAALAVGDALQPDAITLASGTRRIEADLTFDQRQAIQPGSSIRAGTVGWSGTIKEVRDIPRADDAPGPNTAIVTREPIPESMDGEQVFEVVLASTGEPTLSAASAAVHTTADGEPFVVVHDGTDETTIPVTVGVVTDTRIAISPVASDALRPGDELVLNPDR